MTEMPPLESVGSDDATELRELADFFDNASVALHWVGPDGTILRANRAELDLLGYDRDEYLGRHVAEFHADPHVIEDMLARLRRGETLDQFPARLRRKDGGICHVRVSSNALFEDGRFVHTRCFTLDVTDKVRAEQALRESEQRFRAMADAAPMLIWMSGPDEEVIYFNRSWPTYTGAPLEELLGNGWLDLVHPADREQLAEVCGRSFPERRPFTAEFRLRRADGGYGWLLDSGTPRFDAAGAFLGFIGVCVDIDERKRAERQLRLVTDHAPVLLAHCDAGMRFRFVNRAYAERFGLTPEEVIGRPVADVLGEEAFAAIRPYVSEVLAGNAVEFETEVPYRTGGAQFMRCAYRPERDDRGRVVGWVAAIVNITDRKRAEEAVRESEERYRQLAELLPVALYTCAPSGVITYYNHKAADLWGRAPAAGDTDERFCGSLGLYLPDGTRLPHEQCPMALALRDGRAFRNEEVVIRRPDASRLTVLVNIDPLRDAAGRIVGAVNVFHDITALKQAEQALREADRRKDEFLATLAHELRNPLAPIRYSLEILRLAGEDAARLRGAREVMERQVTHLVRLVDDLLDVSRITRDQLELRNALLELAPVVHQAVEICRSVVEEAGHEVSVSLPPEPIWLQADPVRLAQVLGNLLHNACKYTPPGGRIGIRAERRDGEVVLSVRDNGVGIAPEVLPRVFDMFAQGERPLERAHGGLGIGLTLVKRLVEMHGGSVEARSDGVGKGSELVVRLPLADPQAVAGEKQPLSAAPSNGGGRRVLVVDDNVDAATSLALLLEMGGNQATTAHDGLEALRAAEELRPEVVLLDLGLPRMNGYDVCRALRQRPWGRDLTVIALTGWGQEEDRRASWQAGFDGHLVKPVEPDALTRLLAAPEPDAE